MTTSTLNYEIGASINWVKKSFVRRERDNCLLFATLLIHSFTNSRRKIFIEQLLILCTNLCLGNENWWFLGIFILVKKAINIRNNIISDTDKFQEWN